MRFALLHGIVVIIGGDTNRSVCRRSQALFAAGGGGAGARNVAVSTGTATATEHCTHRTIWKQLILLQLFT